MTVYVDELQQYDGRLWCHLATDSLDIDELHQFAEKVGLKRSWFQNHRITPHYDLTANKRSAAIRAGAEVVTSTQLMLLCRRAVPQEDGDDGREL